MLSFALSAVAAAVTVIAALVPTISVPGSSDRPDELYPAPPGYLLPWAGGTIEDVTQGEETTFTHNGAAAYAFDLGLDYDTVVAARSGRVAMVRHDSNSGGCSPEYASAANYVVVDHGDGTSALYLHLAYASSLVQVGDIVAQGQPIAVSGETGVTCGGSDSGPGAHLHFQVQTTEPGKYFTQSQPVAFDDVPRNEGVPFEGMSVVSGNYGRGQIQKIALTPRRVPRVFNPTARPANPDLIEAHPEAAPSPEPAASVEPEHFGATPWAEITPEGVSSETPAIPTPNDATETPEPEDTETPEPTETSEAEPSSTPTPTATLTVTAGGSPQATATPTPGGGGGGGTTETPTP